MADIPRDPRIDSSVAFRAAPYTFIAGEARARRTDAFESRILLRRTVCLTGRAAAATFYDPDLTVRRGAAPAALQKTLLGQGGVQGLDGKAHRHRKALFMALMSPDSVARLVEITRQEWQVALPKWSAMDQVVLYDALHPILTVAACRWAGVPLDPKDLAARSRHLTAMFDKAGSISPLHFYARWARWRSERWIQRLIRDIRSRPADKPTDTALHAIAMHRGLDGRLLPPRIAAVELLNVLRPTVAVSAYIVFLA